MSIFNNKDKKSVQIFISYRREGGEALAHLIHDRLRQKNYRVFLDVESLRSGMFNNALYKKIEECEDFLIVLPKNALNRCVDPEDWVRLEIDHALELNKNIIPIMMRNFKKFSSVTNLVAYAEFCPKSRQSGESKTDVNMSKCDLPYFASRRLACRYRRRFQSLCFKLLLQEKTF